MRNRYLEDLQEGERVKCPSVLVEREEALAFARRYDPRPFHVDEAAAADSFCGVLTASSLHVLALCTRTVVDGTRGVAIHCGVGLTEVRMLSPVRPGDELTIEACWRDIRRSRSKPLLGLATLHCDVCNQRGESVLEYGYKYMLHCRNGTDADATRTNPVRQPL